MYFLWIGSKIPARMTLDFNYGNTLCKSVSMNSKTIYRSLSFSARITLRSLTIFSCSVSYSKKMTSRKVLWESVALWKASKTFLSATVCCDFLSTAFQTTPYAPFPLNSSSSNRLFIWSSTLECSSSFLASLTCLFYWGYCAIYFFI